MCQGLRSYCVVMVDLRGLFSGLGSSFLYHLIRQGMNRWHWTIGTSFEWSRVLLHWLVNQSLSSCSSPRQSPHPSWPSKPWPCFPLPPSNHPPSSFWDHYLIFYIPWVSISRQSSFQWYQKPSFPAKVVGSCICRSLSLSFRCAFSCLPFLSSNLRFSLKNFQG